MKPNKNDGWEYVKVKKLGPLTKKEKALRTEKRLLDKLTWKKEYY